MQINTSVAGGPKPTPRSFGEGRLVLMIPKREQTGTKFESKDPQQEIVCDIVVLPDPSRPQQPPVIFGGKKALDGTMKEPDTHRVDVGPQGWLVENVVISSGGMVWTLRRVLESTTTTGQQQAIVGRFWRDHSPEARGAWKIAGDGHEATPDEVNAAAAWYAAASTGQFTNSVIVPINPIPAQAPAGFSPYGQPQPQTAPPVPAGYAAQPQYGAPQAQSQQFPATNGGYPPAPPAYGGVQTPPANGGFPYGGGPAAPVTSAAPVNGAPQGVDPAVWASWTPEQQQGFYAYQAQQAAQFAQAAPQGMAAPTGY